MAELKIDLNEIIQVATDIRQIESNITKNVDLIGKTIKKAKKKWSGSAVNNLIKKYEGYVQESEDFIHSLEAYSIFLEQSMGIFDSIENALSNFQGTNNSNEWK